MQAKSGIRQETTAVIFDVGAFTFQVFMFSIIILGKLYVVVNNAI